MSDNLVMGVEQCSMNMPVFELPPHYCHKSSNVVRQKLLLFWIYENISCYCFWRVARTLAINVFSQLLLCSSLDLVGSLCHTPERKKQLKTYFLSCKWMDIGYCRCLFLLKTSGNASKESGNWVFAWKGGFLKLGSNFARLPSSNVPWTGRTSGWTPRRTSMSPHKEPSAIYPFCDCYRGLGNANISKI